MLKKIKKIISILLLILTVFSVTQPILAVSGTDNFVGGQFASNIFTTDSTSKPYGVLVRRLINYNTGEKFTVFCAENGISFNTGTICKGEYYTPTYAPIKKACKVAYLGWYSKYGDYVVDGGMSLETKKDYVFTQQMIWEVLEQSNDTFIESNIQEEYENFKEEIYHKIDNLEKKPSFDKENIIIEIGETKVINDENNVLENYNSIDITTDGIRIVHNKGENFMTLTANEECMLNEYRISNDMFKSWGMIKGDTQDNDTTIYFAFKEGVQNQLYSLHYNDPISLAMNLEVERYGRLELTKLNNDGELINGAVFNISGADNYKKDVVVENGKIIIENLKKGTYYVKEVSAPDGYLLNTKIYEVEIKANETATQTIINEEPTGSFELTKTNKDGTLKLEGVTYRIWSEETGYDVTLKTDKNGKINIDSLKLGTYKYQEINSIYGYLIDNKVYSFELKYKDQNTSVVYASAERINDVPTGSFTLIKKNTDGTQTLEGTKYRIWSNNGYDKIFITDKNGQIKVDGLELGKYNYQEIQATYGYLIDNKVYSFELKYKDQNTSVVYANAEKTNDVPTGSFLLIKKDEEGVTTLEGTKYRIWNENGYNKTFTTDKNGQIKVDGLELGKYNYQEIQATYGYLIDNKIYSFELKYKDQNTSVVYANAERINRKPTGTFTLTKKNADKSLNLEGVVYRIWSDNGYDKTFTTDKNGQIKVEKLKLGTYNYQEISTIKGYVIDNKKYTFKLEYANQNTDVIYSSVECINEETTGNFELTKTNKDGTIKLEGVTYRIWSEETGYDVTLKTDKEGKIIVNGLKLGKYNYQEIQTTYGYLIDNTVYPFELKYKDQNTKIVYASVEKTNDVPTGSFLLIKKDEDEVTTLEGTKYRIWSENGYNKTFTTDKNGQIKVDGLELGKYNYQEIQATYGYLIDNKIYSFELKYKDQNTSVVYANAERINRKPTGTFTLTKKNADKSLNLEGVVYRIWSDNGYDKTFTTNKNGQIKVEKLKLGTYNYQEISTIKGYVIDNKIYSFELKYKDQNTSIVYANAERTNDVVTGTFTLIKKNEDKSSNLEGVKYRIWNNNGYDKTFITDKDGQIKVEGLNLGEYNYQEIKTIEGYLIDNKIYSFELKYKDQNTSVIYYNAEKTNSEPTGILSIVKRDSENGNLAQGDGTLKGAIYKVFADEDIYNKAKTKKYYSKGDLVATRITDESGQTEKIENLPLGNYIIKEVVAPNGYLLNTEEYKVELKYKDQNTKVISSTVTSNEIVKKMQVNLFKSGIKVNSGLVNGLEGAEFTIKLNNDVEKAYTKGYTYAEIWNGIDELGNKVKVDKKRVVEAQDIAPTYETIVTDSNGNAYTTNNLPYGKYIVKETYTPEDYERAIDFIFSITQDESEVKEIAKKVKHLVINNEQLETYIKIVKQDLKTGKTVTLNSATFEIKATKDIFDRSTGKIIFKNGETVSQKIGGTNYSTFTTNTDNIVVIDNSYNNENDYKGTVITPLTLPVGTYEIKEIRTPQGFLQLQNPVSFKVNGIKDYDKDNDGDYIKEVIVKNEQPTGTIIIEKSVLLREDINKSLIDTRDLSKIEFKLIAKEDIINAIDGSIIYKLGTEIGKYNLYENGNLQITNLPLGVYEIQETQTLDGLVLNTTKYEIKLTQKDFVTKVYKEILNIINDTTCVEFSKQDITGEKELIGAKLSVIDENNKVIDTWTSTDKTHKIEGLLVNKIYTLREEIAPDGYVVATDITFTVKDTKEIQKVTMIDKIIEITKTDITTGKELEGAELKVIDEEGKIIDTWVSTNEPHKVKGLKENKTYKLIEVTAPYGYEITEEIEFTVTEDKETQKIEMKDMPIIKNEFENQEIDTPKTGDERNTLLWITLLGISITLLTILVVCEIFKKRKKNRVIKVA